jgi:DNA/RNA endonuclease YhcR with UshA esterase domain
MKLSKCTIQNSKNHYIQVIHAYFTTYIHIHDTYMSLSLQAIDWSENHLTLDVKYPLIKNPTQ